MTVPTNWIFPLHSDKILSETPDLREQHWREFIFSVSRMYEELAQGINGDIRSNAASTSVQWTPTLQGATTAGTFTYTSQIGWAYRQGLFVDLFFDVVWSAAGTAAGNLYLQLPYEVATSSQKPFVGVVQSSGITYTGGTGIVVNAIPGTYRGEFWNVGSAFTSANQAVVASGQLIGHVRYIGKANE